jgi:hypothetical protein
LSITTLCNHLLSKPHIDIWIAECKRLDIQITAQHAAEVIAAHQGVPFDRQASFRPQFTQEHFLDAIAEFIVATDQVESFFLNIFLFYYLNIFIAP